MLTEVPSTDKETQQRLDIQFPLQAPNSEPSGTIDKPRSKN